MKHRNSQGIDDFRQQLDPELVAALKDDPAGGICAACGKENTFCDDVGFFYKNDNNGDYRAHCEDCNGPLTGDR